MQQRMQTAGWSADVERWESDEDSEDSEDEMEADEAVGTVSKATLLRLISHGLRESGCAYVRCAGCGVTYVVRI